jgi:hypothetical protein
MAICHWCAQEMSVASSCTVAAFHLDGRPFEMVAFGADTNGGAFGQRCGDCGVVLGGLHHPGCDVQRCPSCRGQMATCGCRFDEDGAGDSGLLDANSAGEPLMVDRDGVLVERRWVGGREVIVHYDDVPTCDVTAVSGIPCTTALRTVIDLAADVDRPHLERIVHDALDRGLFTVDEAWSRLARPDMATRAGAVLLREVLPAPT